MIDVVQQINAVQRVVGSRTLEAGEARVVTVSQSYSADLEDVWDACTNIERIPRWFLPISGELVLGGRYQFTGNAGGVIERCDPPTGFGATWEYGGDVSWVEVRLTTPEPGTTLFTLEHTAAVNDELWAQFGPGAVGIGWELGLMGLAQYLSTSAGVTPEAGPAWMASAEGKEFMTLSSQRWCDASIASGTDGRAAQEAADRTTAAYTATPAAADS